MASYFALVGDRALRVVLSADAQQSLDQIFQNALADFQHDALERVAFDGRYNPEDDELLAVQPFAVPESITQPVANPAAAERLVLNGDADAAGLPHIKALFAEHDGVLCFQRFMQSQFLARSRFSLVYSRETFSQMTNPGLTVRSDLACVVDDDSLLFRSFFVARTIFDLGEHYREATNDDLEAFATHDALFVEDQESFQESADQNLRRMIAVVMDSGVLDEHTPSAIARTAARFNIQLATTRRGGRERLVLPETKRDVKIALKFLQEDVYRGPLSERAFVTNSKRSLRT